MNLIDILVFEEGYRDRPYLCSEGYVTIGFGTKLHNEKGHDPEQFSLVVNRDIAKAMLLNDVSKMELALSHTSVGHIFDKLDNDRRAVILSMTYQMGVNGVLNFRKMWKALEAGNWEEAGVQALDSRWARQTASRASRHAAILAGETIRQIYGR